MHQAAPPPDFGLAMAQCDLAGCADELAQVGRIRIAPALLPEAAQALHTELTDSTAWKRTMRQGKTEREIEPAALARLEPRQLQAIEQFARQGDAKTFRFLHDAIRISADRDDRLARGLAIDLFVEAMNSERVLRLITGLAGEPVTSFHGDATRYLPGHFLTTHNDGRKFGRRVLALVLNLSHWHIDWGGLMLFHDANGDVACGWTPQFNSVNLFSVPQDHSVSWVTPLAPVPRLAIAGWFFAD